MNIKLIALDMDGTTLDAGHNVTSENKAAIEEALNQGIEVIVSTGRSNTELLPLWEQLPQVRYFSCGNGSKIFDRHRNCNIFEDLMGFDQAVAVLDILKDYDVFPEIYIGDQIYAEKAFYENIAAYVDPGYKELVLSTRTPKHDLPKLLQQWQKPIEKINAFLKDTACRPHIIERCSEMEIAMTNALGVNIEMTSPTASKGNALHHLCRQLGIDAAEVMAIGDGCNDVSMLEYAGCSIAMANAAPEAKAAAKFTTSSNEESGVAASIRRYALQ